MVHNVTYEPVMNRRTFLKSIGAVIGLSVAAKSIDTIAGGYALAQTDDLDRKVLEQIPKQWGKYINERKWEDLLSLYREDAMIAFGSDNKQDNKKEFEKYLNTSERAKRTPPMTVNPPDTLKVDGNTAEILFNYMIYVERQNSYMNGGRVTMNLVKEPDGKWLIKETKEN